MRRKSVAYAARSSEKAREELNEIRESLKLKQGGWALFKINRNVRRAVFLGMLCRRCSSLPV
ncbi:hypothetical protein ACLK17_17185 [Escherichia coli]